ncbi:protein TolR [Kangiella aquimarina]|uniref:Protein TolR n=1 Tax=Kangiella aquimarina TaxID=261965 RepID=A0ABZ0X6X9_9GAMM|nr:protein TolR [Kangiella aquimarina]WQG86361.1 protein TolR [Kangiella aquimarina]
MTQLVRRERRRPNAEINVVPYIDVMLVLLVIFMITAPLITAGIDVELPSAHAEPISPDEVTPFVVGVRADESFHMDIGSRQFRDMTLEELMSVIAKEQQNTPNAPIMIKGDRNVPYGTIVELMDQLRQQFGVENVGLMTNPL